MFGNLIESGSHAADLKRKSSFFIGTTLFYGLLMLATGVGSIYAYNARLEERGDEYELLAIMRFAPADTREPRREAAKPAANRSSKTQVAVRANPAFITPYHADRVEPESSRDVPAGARFIVGPIDSGPIEIGSQISGPVRPGNGFGRTDGPLVEDNGDEGEPPPAAAKPTPAPTQHRPTGPISLSTGVLSGKAINKPAPPYPAIAKQVKIQGTVSVQVLIDEHGRVTNAKATSGHPLLQGAAVQAAYRASFTPTFLSGQPVKVTGVITYNFVLQ